VENLSPGALERVGLGYARVAAINPRLIYLSMAAAGQTGPLAGMRAYAPIMSSFCGIESLIGYPREAPIGMMNFGYGDPNAAVHALIPLLAAVHEREVSGRGQHIDMSQLEAMLAVFAEALIDHTMNGRAARATGNGSPSMAPHGIYPAAGDDAWVSIAVADDAQWQALIACMGAPGWAQEAHLTTATGRVSAAAALDAALAAWTSTRPAPALAAALRAAGIACSPVQDIAAQWVDPQFEARGIRVATTHRLTGAERLYRTPWMMERNPPHIRVSAPLLGEHNAKVFCDLLGLTPSELAQLKADGVIA
jgi:crotonobetainyl-CoA:carnitine CoA-transferase CaiB-like acyl-CoA transferase